MTQDPRAFHAFDFADSNEYRWRVSRSSVSAPIVIKAETDAPYTKRTLSMPPNADEREVRAMVEAAVAVPERSKVSAKAQAWRRLSTDQPKPAQAKPERPGNWLALLLIAGVVWYAGKR